MALLGNKCSLIMLFEGRRFFDGASYGSSAGLFIPEVLLSVGCRGFRSTTVGSHIAGYWVVVDVNPVKVSLTIVVSFPGYKYWGGSGEYLALT
jgi:hypothetical protein